MAEQEEPGRRQEQAATARKFGVSVVLAVAGLLLIGYGLFAPDKWFAVIPGVLLTVIFGVIATGARRAKAAVGPKGVSAEAEYEGLRPERDGDRR